MHAPTPTCSRTSTAGMRRPRLASSSARPLPTPARPCANAAPGSPVARTSTTCSSPCHPSPYCWRRLAGDRGAVLAHGTGHPLELQRALLRAARDRVGPVGAVFLERRRAARRDQAAARL